MMDAIADTSFLIDWARYSRRDLIYSLFELIHVPETVLAEVQSEATLTWIVDGLIGRRMALFTETEDVIAEARRITSLSRALPMRSIDLPEAVCLAAGMRHGYMVLTENGGAAMAPAFIDVLRDVRVARAIDVLYMLAQNGLIDLREEVARYQAETGHRFARRDLTRIGLMDHG